MGEYEQRYLNLEVEPHIRFDANNTGEFQFGYVGGNMAVDQTARDGKPVVEWTWEGTIKWTMRARGDGRRLNRTDQPPAKSSHTPATDRRLWRSRANEGFAIRAEGA